MVASWMPGETTFFDLRFKSGGLCFGLCRVVAFVLRQHEGGCRSDLSIVGGEVRSQ
jgi:hypothetical protein